jgi:hypothetical protein
MAREVEADLVVHDKSERGLDAAARNVRRTSDKINESLKKLGVHTIDLKANPRDALRDIDKTARRLRELSAQSATVEIKMDNDRALASLLRFRKQLAKGIEGGVADAAPEVEAGLRGALSKAATTLAPVLAGMAVIAVPFIASTISAAVIGGAGLGGVVGGVLLASRDPRVAAAATSLGKTMLDTMSRQAAVFVEPVLHAIELIRANFLDVGSDLRGIFAAAAKFVEPLTKGAVSAIRAITAGVHALVANAGPVIDVIAHGIEGLGLAIGDVLKRLSQDGPAAALALSQVFGIAERAIIATGIALHALTVEFSILAKIGAFGPQAQREIIAYEANAKIAAATTNDVAEAFNASSFGAAAAAGAIGILKTQAEAAAQQVRDLANAEHSLFDAQTGAAEATARLTESIKANGRTLDVHTEKGRANRTALSNLATALNADYDAYVKVNGAGAGANRVAAQNYAAFFKAAYGITHSKKAADALARSLGLIPPKVPTKVTAETAAAAAAIAGIKRALAELHGKTVYVTVKRTGDIHVSGPGGSGTQLKGAATAMWSASAGGGSYRTGGPQRGGLSATVENTIFLDGSPFRAYTDSVALAERRRADYRRRVGARR